MCLSSSPSGESRDVDKMKWILALIIGVIAVGSVFAFKGFGDREQIRDAIVANDYETWKELMESQLTEERFIQLVER